MVTRTLTGLNTRQALGRTAADQRTLRYFEDLQKQVLEQTPSDIENLEIEIAAAAAAAAAALLAAQTAQASADAAQSTANNALTLAAEALEAAQEGPFVNVTPSEYLPGPPTPLVSLWNDAGTGKVRLADNTDDTKQPDGFVQMGFGTGETARMRTTGEITGFTGLTPGALYFLGTAGGITATLPTSGWVQIVGRAIDTTRLLFAPENGFLA